VDEGFPPTDAEHLECLRARDKPAAGSSSIISR